MLYKSLVPKDSCKHFQNWETNCERLFNLADNNELFNLADNNFVRSDNRKHAYKLGRPAPKVRSKFAQPAIFFIVVLLLR